MTLNRDETCDDVDQHCLKTFSEKFFLVLHLCKVLEKPLKRRRLWWRLGKSPDVKSSNEKYPGLNEVVLTV